MNNIQAQTSIRSEVLEIRRKQFLYGTSISDLLQTADFHIENQLYEEALWDLNECDSLNPNSIEKENIIFRKALVYLLTNRENEGIIVLNSCKSLNSQLLKVMLLNQAGRFTEAKQEFEQYFSQDTLWLEEFNQCLEKSSKSIKNEKIARLLSQFLPGLGQVYVGKISDGLRTFLFVSGFITVAALSIANGYYLTGIFTGVQFALRFYQGGIKNSTNNAIKYNKNFVKKISIELNTLLLNRYSYLFNNNNLLIK